ncbi:hypothetical protein Bbelb_213750 [Branchiostoma belcheri]|nr:hypothetical protein Bbelb_213750 [Branchiostoma belcheri]
MAHGVAVGKSGGYGDDFAYCCSSGDSSLNLTREDWTRPLYLETEYEDKTGLDQTRPDFKIEDQEQEAAFAEDWTRPDDLKTLDDYQWWGLLSEPDKRRLDQIS